MNYLDIKTFTQRCDEHPAHQTGMVSDLMLLHRAMEEIDELRDYIETRYVRSTPKFSDKGFIENACKKCGGVLRLGKVPGGPGKLTDCLKCVDCGWSQT